RFDLGAANEESKGRRTPRRIDTLRRFHLTKRLPSVRRPVVLLAGAVALCAVGRVTAEPEAAVLPLKGAAPRHDVVAKIREADARIARTARATPLAQADVDPTTRD